MFARLSALLALSALAAGPLALSPVQASASCNGTAGEVEMSVEGVEGVFCVAGAVCTAMSGAGACPTEQTGLLNGSHCGLVRSGVYGCLPGPAPSSTPTAAPTSAPTSTPAPTTAAETLTPTSTPTPTPTPTPSTSTSSNSTASGCPSGSGPVSVEGLQGAFCAPLPICMGTETDTGSCPGPQPGLPDGSQCARVASGVFGCTLGGSPVANATTATPTPTPTPTSPTTHDRCQPR